MVFLTLDGFAPYFSRHTFYIILYSCATFLSFFLSLFLRTSPEELEAKKLSSKNNGCVGCFAYNSFSLAGYVKINSTNHVHVLCESVPSLFALRHNMRGFSRAVQSARERSVAVAYV